MTTKLLGLQSVIMMVLRIKKIHISSGKIGWLALKYHVMMFYIITL